MIEKEPQGDLPYRENACFRPDWRERRHGMRRGDANLPQNAGWLLAIGYWLGAARWMLVVSC